LDEMRASLNGIFSRLRPGRYAVLVVGDSVFEGKVFRTSEKLAAAGEMTGFEGVGVVARPVHATRRSFIPPARRAKSEALLILRRPTRRFRAIFEPPPYRMWPYEIELRRRESEALMKTHARAYAAQFQSDVDPYCIDRAQRLAFTH